MKKILTSIGLVGLLITSGFGITRSEVDEIRNKYHMNTERVREFSEARSVLYFAEPTYGAVLPEKVHEMIRSTVGNDDQVIQDIYSHNAFASFQGEYPSTFPVNFFLDTDYKDIKYSFSFIQDLLLKCLKDEGISLEEKKAYVEMAYKVYVDFIKDGTEMLKELDLLLHSNKRVCAPEMRGVKLCQPFPAEKKWKETLEDENCLKNNDCTSVLYMNLGH